MLMLRDGRIWAPEAAALLASRASVGLIGFGNIARSVAARLAGWQVRLLVHSRSLIDPGATGAEPPSAEPCNP